MAVGSIIASIPLRVGSTRYARSMGDAIGLVGLGVIGQLYAGHLIRAQGALVAYDLDPAHVQAAVALGATAATSAKAVAEASDVIVLALPNPPAVLAAMLGEEGVLAGARPGTLVDRRQHDRPGHEPSRLRLPRAIEGSTTWMPR